MPACDEAERCKGKLTASAHSEGSVTKAKNIHEPTAGTPSDTGSGAGAGKAH
jgi:hypothetical protein